MTFHFLAFLGFALVAAALLAVRADTPRRARTCSAMAITGATLMVLWVGALVGYQQGVVSVLPLLHEPAEIEAAPLSCSTLKA